MTPGQLMEGITDQDGLKETMVVVWDELDTCTVQAKKIYEELHKAVVGSA